MKKTILLLIISALVTGVLAQAPQKFNYQAVARDASGDLLISTSLTVQIGILQNSTVVWQEDHSVVTNEFGLFALEIGDPMATKTGGTAAGFADIDWGTGVYSMNVMVDDGSGFVDMGDNELLSVPYALHAVNGPTGPPGEKGDPGIQGAQGEPGVPGAKGETGAKGDKGDKGDAGTGLVNQGSWVSGNTYNPGDYVFDRSVDDPLINSMWILEGDAWLSTLQPYNDQDHWVEFQAPEGPQGIQGMQGEQGEQGVPGSQGIQGEKGDKGDKGDPGDDAGDDQTLTFSSPNLSISGGNSVNLADLQGSTAWVSDGTDVSTSQDVGIGTTVLNNASLAIQGDDPSQEEALFEVRKADGEPVFSVYNEGVRVYVEEDGKGIKGGFAVGGYNQQSKGIGQTFFSVTKDSSRIYFDESAKGIKGGFAVGGYNAGSSKGPTNQLMSLEPDNYLIGHSAGAGLTGQYNQFIGYESGMGALGVNNNVYLGYQAGKNNTDGSANVLIGYKSGMNGSNSSGNNVFIGYKCGQNSNGTGSVFIGDEAGALAVGNGWGNVFIGQRAGLNNDGAQGSLGARNVFVGREAGRDNTTGGDNTYLGAFTGVSNTTGQENVAIGADANSMNTTGSYNCYIGWRAGLTNSGSNNVVQGHNAGSAHSYHDVPTNYSNSVMMGTEAGFWSNTGNNNTYIGYRAGYLGEAAKNNVMIGYMAGNDNQTGEGNIFIGHEAGLNEEGSNQLYISNSSTETPLIKGDFEVGTITMYADVEATTITEPSDIRFKKDIEPIFGALKMIENLTGVYFNWDQNNEAGRSFKEKRQIGFIAQELEKVVPEVVSSSDMGYLSVNYGKLSAVLLEAIKEQQTELEEQQSKNNMLSQKLENQEMLISDLLKRIEALESK